MHSFAKLNKCADLGLVFNSHNNKKLLFSPSCKSTFYALFWVHLFNVKLFAIKQLTGKEISLLQLLSEKMKFGEMVCNTFQFNLAF